MFLMVGEPASPPGDVQFEYHHAAGEPPDHPTQRSGGGGTDHVAFGRGQRVVRRKAVGQVGECRIEYGTQDSSDVRALAIDLWCVRHRAVLYGASDAVPSSAGLTWILSLPALTMRRMVVPVGGGRTGKSAGGRLGSSAAVNKLSDEPTAVAVPSPEIAAA
jgi:hypothetical protein